LRVKEIVDAIPASECVAWVAFKVAFKEIPQRELRVKEIVDAI
jgi:hypothetical protein